MLPNFFGGIFAQKTVSETMLSIVHTSLCRVFPVSKTIAKKRLCLCWEQRSQIYFGSVPFQCCTIIVLHLLDFVLTYLFASFDYPTHFRPFCPSFEIVFYVEFIVDTVLGISLKMETTS